jgi:hypothetical protein
MKQDIEIPVVENVYIAAVQFDNNEGGKDWWVVLINATNGPLENIIINSRGYETLESKGGRTTSSLRKRIGVLPTKATAKLEPIMPEVFDLFNEYWVTFFEDGQLKDRKYIFGPHTIDDSMVEPLPVLGESGILIK